MACVWLDLPHILRQSFLATCGDEPRGSVWGVEPGNGMARGAGSGLNTPGRGVSFSFGESLGRETVGPEVENGVGFALAVCGSVVAGVVSGLTALGVASFLPWKKLCTRAFKDFVSAAAAFVNCGLSPAPIFE